MYARAITFQVRPDVTTEMAADLYRELVAIVSGQPGFVCSTFLMNPDTRRAISLSYWSDRESAAEAGPRVLPLMLVKARPLVVAPPDITGYQVIEQAPPRSIEAPE